jgi:hypothetical protein
MPVKCEHGEYLHIHVAVLFDEPAVFQYDTKEKNIILIVSPEQSNSMMNLMKLHKN